jgi:hypothetical protein
MAQVDKSLAAAEISYGQLMTNIRDTQADFASQQFASAVQVLSPGRTDAVARTRRIVRAGALGLFLGAVAGMGLSLLGLYLVPSKNPTA